MSNEGEGKRIIVPPKRENEIEVQVLPNVAKILDSALSILDAEISKLGRDIRQGNEMTPARARILNEYMKNLISVAKEQRESAKNDGFNLDDMSTLELQGIQALIKNKLEERENDKEI